MSIDMPLPAPANKNTPNHMTLSAEKGRLLSVLQQHENNESRAANERVLDPLQLPTRVDIQTTFSHDGTNSLDWNDYCNNDDNPQFEVLTKEYVEVLGDYLAKRAGDLGHSSIRTMRVLEVGAGNGRLSYFLNEYLSRNYSGLAVVLATDSGEYDWIKPVFPVETLNHKEALNEYSPDIVICSWMSPNEDFTADFRRTQSVKEYVLIGEPDICGKEWDTWGINLDNPDTDEMSPFETDGFTIEPIENIPQEIQFCRTDNPAIDNPHSFTISFKRPETLMYK